MKKQIGNGLWSIECHVTLTSQGRDPNMLRANISKTAGDAI